MFDNEYAINDIIKEATKKHYAIFFASGSKGLEIRADGNGSHLDRGYWFKTADGLHGPYVNKSIAIRARDRIVLK